MKRELILASNSPRRRELLKTLGLEFEIIADHTPECVDKNLSPDRVVMELAKFKGENVIEIIGEKCDAVVIAADTVVTIDGEILGKPKSEKDAELMLLKLSGRSHYVYTGMYIKNICTKKAVCFCEKTEVFFKNLDITEIKDYINTGEPMDKAGAYGIQSLGSLFVEKINGDYFNVVGLPLFRLGETLKNEFDIKIF